MSKLFNPLRSNGGSGTITPQPAALPDTQTIRWKRDWISPKKASSQQSHPIIIPTSNGAITSSNEPTYNFQVKTWVVDTNNVFSVEHQDSIKLADYRYLEVEEPSGNGLTNADIRGAVGGDEIAGFSSSAAQQLKEDEEKENKELETPSLLEGVSVEQTPAYSISESAVPDTSNEDTPMEESTSVIDTSVVVSTEETPVVEETIAAPIEEQSEEPKEQLEEPIVPKDEPKETKPEEQDAEGDVKME